MGESCETPNKIETLEANYNLFWSRKSVNVINIKVIN